MLIFGRGGQGAALLLLGEHLVELVHLRCEALCLGIPSLPSTQPVQGRAVRTVVRVHLPHVVFVVVSRATTKTRPPWAVRIFVSGTPTVIRDKSSYVTNKSQLESYRILLFVVKNVIFHCRYRIALVESLARKFKVIQKLSKISRLPTDAI